MTTLRTFPLCVVIVALLATSAFSQQFGGGGAGAGTRGLTQTGEITSAASTQRNASSFLSATPGGFLSNTGSGGTGGQAGGNILSSLGGLGGGFGGGGFGGGGFGNQGFQTQGQNGTTPQLRIPMRLGFTPRNIRTPVAVSTEFQSRLHRIPGLESAAPQVEVRVLGRKAVLAGVVSSQHQRELIATLALLEPGIWDVQNDLQVSPAAPGSWPAP